MGRTWLEMVRVTDTGAREGGEQGRRWAVRPRGRGTRSPPLRAHGWHRPGSCGEAPEPRRPDPRSQPTLLLPCQAPSRDLSHRLCPLFPGFKRLHYSTEPAQVWHSLASEQGVIQVEPLLIKYI